MIKYNPKLVYNYIMGNDIYPYDIEKLEDDYNFMTSVIVYSKDKNFYNLCSTNLKNNYKFLKFLINTFNNDEKFILKIVDYYLENTTNEIEKIELNIMMSNLKDSEPFFKYHVKTLAFYYCLMVDLEDCKIDKKIFEEGFIILYTMYGSSEIIMNFLAKEFIKNIFSNINLEELIHKKYKTFEDFMYNGKNNFLLNIIGNYDESLENYLKVNIENLDVLDCKLLKIKKNWNFYIKKVEDDKCFLIIDKVHEYIEEHDLEINYTEQEILELILNELNIKDKMKKYFSYDEDYNYLKLKEELNYDINKRNFSFLELKHYLNIKKLILKILKNKYNEYDEEFKFDKLGKIIEFKKIEH